MKYATNVVGGTITILAADDYTAIPVRLQDSSTVYKAGTPLTEDGAAALDGTNAVGILLYDVDTSVNPNGAMVVAGVIDYLKIVANATVTASASTLHSAIPAITFRSNIKVTPVLTASVSTLTVAASDTETFTITNAVGTVTVKSSATGKATAVESSGTVTVTGVAEGTAVITVTDANGNTVAVDVTVTAAVVG